MTPSRDYDEQRLGILYFLTQIRISTLDIARDADIEIPTCRPLDSIGNPASLAMDILICLIVPSQVPLFVLSHGASGAAENCVFVTNHECPPWVGRA